MEECGNEVGHEYKWVLSRVWKCHFAHVSACEWVMSHMYLGAYGGMWKWSWARIQMSLVTNMKVSFRTCICIWMSHITHVSRRVWRNVEMKLGTNTNESCHAYESVISHIHPHMNESCRTYIWIIWMRHVAHISRRVWRNMDMKSGVNTFLTSLCVSLGLGFRM